MNKIKPIKKAFILILIGILLISLVYASENFNETKKLIDSNISCDKLTGGQLGEMGDYYMEQMHPGESHEIMHKMMGGEDSEIVKQMHINMAKSIYCGEQNQGMMSMMMGMGDNNMMSGNYKGVMSGSYGNGMMWYGWLNGLLVTIILILLVAWLIKQITKKK